ncbi:site-specific tyrosine recombinase XerC [Gemmata sp. SH-PL17]|uniref:tyrosine-type recombinase/integrase n=1 Tax=Gemmata sp. SH-PL17 TaxID=1630693 RepID=UPI00078ED42C|nr:tyrosine-type recombinase/integrase [Gemmata sp. SH-PL17]AMV29378.1 site-specific tyrosine recombinase XerC [Gemmata sp. SH-PL17]
MPRVPKPYVERGWYISRPSGQYLKLCPVEEGMTEAKRILQLKLGELEHEREQMGGRTAPKLTVVELFALFLGDVETTKDGDTFLDYRRWCTEFAKVYGSKLARAITRGDANDFRLKLMKAKYVVGKQAPRPYKPKTVNHALITLRRAFNWAIETERLPNGKNPFAKVELLHCEGRQRVATEEEYQALLANCTDDAFRDVLIAMRHTSARPQDIYHLTWEMVDWERQMWVLPKHKASRTARVPKPRVIGMSAAVEAVLRRRVETFGSTGHVFLNGDGQPWTKDALGLRMRRLRVRAGVEPNEQGEQFVLYTNRHTFLTEAGNDPSISAAVLMGIAGNTNLSTTQRYVHMEVVEVARAGRGVAERRSKGVIDSAPASGG